MADMGQIITIVGLFIQLIFFGAFLTISIIFGRRVQQTKTALRGLPYGSLLYVLFAVSGLIIFRCLYRIVEFCQGNDGYLMKHEVFMYIFDTIPMFAVQAVFHFYHPGKIIIPRLYNGLGTEMR
jgi:TRAP-type C4-dicarboxylate transport system permease small subunit